MARGDHVKVKRMGGLYTHHGIDVGWKTDAAIVMAPRSGFAWAATAGVSAGCPPRVWWPAWAVRA
jgi:hypothetical protein